MPLISGRPSPDDADFDDAMSRPSKATQKLTAQSVKPARTTQTWWRRLAQPMALPHATQLGLSAAGGALATALASLAIGWIVAREPIRDFFGRTGEETLIGSDRALEVMVDSSDSEPARPKIDVRPAASVWPVAQPESVTVEGANEDGTALAALAPLTGEDRRRIEKRREDDRMLREKRSLEDQKRAIERQLEDKQLEEKRRTEDAQASDGRRDEDKKRIEGWLEEDRRQLDERNQKEKAAIADAQRSDNQQLAEAQR